MEGTTPTLWGFHEGKRLCRWPAGALPSLQEGLSEAVGGGSDGGCEQLNGFQAPRCCLHLTLDMPFTFRACSSVSEKAGLDQKACQGDVPIIPFHDGIGIETLRW